jgi:hypothetical protein
VNLFVPSINAPLACATLIVANMNIRVAIAQIDLLIFIVFTDAFLMVLRVSLAWIQVHFRKLFATSYALPLITNASLLNIAKRMPRAQEQICVICALKGVHPVNFRPPLRNI